MMGRIALITEFGKFYFHTLIARPLKRFLLMAFPSVVIITVGPLF
jgi:hypothetical protein